MQEESALRRLQGAVCHRFMPHLHSALLGAIVAAFATRPLIGNNRGTLIVFSLLIVVLMILGLYIIQVDELIGEEKKAPGRAQATADYRMDPGLGGDGRTPRDVLQREPRAWNRLHGLVAAIFAFITWHELRAVLRQREVTSETICMSISVYLLMGFTWGFLYSLIYQLEPHAFSFPGADILTVGLPTEKQKPVFLVLICFSLVTLRVSATTW